ncbi:MAG TPA: hypothetical protein VHL11_07235, partial [Phototrophicaceae bacterium]|nr:hypothetical protein [Phototrophicaceae bacterium]
MQDTNRRTTMQRSILMLMSVLTLFTLVLTLGVSAPVMGQAAEPTGTPSDPAWRGFAAARAALEEEKSIDLTFVRNYTFDQIEWTKSIDSCKEAIAETDYRPIYWGWDYRITDMGGTIYRVRVSFDLKAVVVCDKVEQASDVPATGGGDLPAPVAGGAAGGSFELGGHIADLTSSAKTAMSAAGMTWVKRQ